MSPRRSKRQAAKAADPTPTPATTTPVVAVAAAAKKVVAKKVVAKKVVAATKKAKAAPTVVKKTTTTKAASPTPTPTPTPATTTPVVVAVAAAAKKVVAATKKTKAAPTVVKKTTTTSTKAKASTSKAAKAPAKPKAKAKADPKGKGKAKATAAVTTAVTAAAAKKKKVPESDAVKAKSKSTGAFGKGRVRVHEKSGKGGSHKVYQDPESETFYNFLGNQTEVSNNANKFYVIQMLENGGDYCLFTHWGRVGYDGQLATQSYGLDACKSAFAKKYKDKTGNNWADRENFVPKNKKYIPVETKNTDIPDDDDQMDEEADDVVAEAKKEKAEKVKIPDSKLATPVQDLMKLIFNVNQFTEQVREMRYDIDKMPLGALTDDQIDSGMEALKEIESCITNNKSTVTWTNAFYTRIPHDFGFRRPALINTMNDVTEKIRLLDTLSDIKQTMSLIKEATAAPLENPLDSNYNQLKATLTPVDRKSKDFTIVSDYMKNSHGQSHSSYTLSIEDIFKMDKDVGFDDTKTSPSTTKLLWHGSRLSNWSSIISQGLRIAPPSAPVTGYMFGKGVYFADSVSKSANYCFTDSNNNTGLLLLCEVQVGDEDQQLQVYDSDHMLHTKFNKKGFEKLSTVGMGLNMPDPKSDIIHENVTVPVGKMIDTKRKNSNGYMLQYNEYIVYNTTQIKPKYLIKTKFNYGNSRW